MSRKRPSYGEKNSTDSYLGADFLMYWVNRKLVSVIRLAIPMGTALLAGYFLEELRAVANLGPLFLLMGFVGNYYFPEIITINNNILYLKTVMAKKPKEFPMENLEVSVDQRGRYLILNLDRKYLLDITTMSKDLYYQLKPHIRIQQNL